MFSIKKWLAKGLSTNKLDNLLECKLQVKSNDDEIKNLQNAISELEKEIEKREEKNKKLEKEMLGCLDVLFEKENVEIGGAEIINKADKVDDEVKNEENIIEDKSYVNELDDVWTTSREENEISIHLPEMVTNEWVPQNETLPIEKNEEASVPTIRKRTIWKIDENKNVSVNDMFQKVERTPEEDREILANILNWKW